MFPSIMVEKCMVLLKLESSLNDTASLSILLVLKVVINSILLSAPIVLLLTILVLNLLEPILTSDFCRTTLIILSVFSTSTHEQAWILLLWNFFSAVVVTSRIYNNLVVGFGVDLLVIVMQNSSPTQERDCYWGFFLTLLRIVSTLVKNSTVSRKPPTSALMKVSMIGQFISSLQM